MATSEQLSPAVRPKRHVSAGKLVLLCVLAFLLLFLAVFAIGMLISARQLRAELDKIRAAGEPVTAADLDAFYAYPPKDRDTTQLWLDAFAVIDSPGYESDARPLAIVGETKGLPSLNEPWPQLDAAEAFLTKYQAPLEKMHRAAELGGEARFPAKFSLEGGGLILPRILQTRAAAQLLALEAEVHAHRGDPRAAAQSVRAILALARSLDREPLSVSQLIRIAINGVACEQIERLLPVIQFSEADLVQFERDLGTIDDETGFRRALLTERATWISTIEDTRGWGNGPRRFYHFATSKGDQTVYLQLMAKFVTASNSEELPLRDAILQTDAEVAALLKSRFAAWRYPITTLIEPSFRPWADAVCGAQARQAATRTAIAIERYRRKTGATPKSLDELVPEFLDQPPVDPFDQAPLRYKSHAAGYKIYSVGADGIDQGGDTSAAGRLVDIVFEVRAKASVDAAAPSPGTPGATEQPSNAGE